MGKWKPSAKYLAGNNRIFRRKAVFLSLLFALCSWSVQADSVRLDSLEGLARMYYRSDLDSSRYFAAEVERLARQETDHAKVAWAMNWTAITFLKNGFADSVSYHLDRCLAYCAEHDVPDVEGKARLNRSINLYQQGNYENAISSGLKALTHFEAVKDTLGVAHASYNTGLSYQRMERIAEAQKFYRRALPIYLQRGGVLDRANAYNAIGSAFNKEGETDSALYYFRQAVNEKLAVEAWAYCGSEYSNIADILERDGHRKEALEYYTRSFQAFNAIGDQRGMALVAGNLSKFKLEVAEWDSAIYYGNISLEFAEETEDRFLLSKSHKRLAEAYRERGKFDLAYYHDQRNDSLEELIRNAEVQKNMDELHIRYETEKRERELIKERYANQRKNFWLIGTVAGIVGLLVAIFLIYRSEREKKKRLLANSRARLEAERNRISMDLHDHLGAELSVITSRLDTQAYRLADTDTRKELNRLADQAREASAQLRETIWSVRETEVSLEQMARKIREFAQRNLEDSGMTFHLQTDGTAQFTPAQGLDLFRILQEGINNARKYSEGSRIDLVIRREGNRLHLTLSDDGKGFAPDEVRPGYGLGNMQERVRLLGGEMEIDGQDGTRIGIDLPLKA